MDLNRRRFLSAFGVAHSTPFLKKVQGEEKRPPRITGWTHSRDFDLAVKSLQSNHLLINEISPMWYEIQEDLSLAHIPGYRTEDPGLMHFVSDKPIVLRPIITNVNSVPTNPGLVLNTLRDPDKLERLVANVQKVAENWYYHGVDIDFEGIRNDDLRYMAAFIERLRDVLTPMGKSVAVELEWQRSDVVLPHWKRMGEASDNVRFMAYSEHTERTSPGPIASIEWGKWFLERAVGVIPNYKLTHGIAIYGRVWGPQRNYSATWEVLTRYAEGSEIRRNEEGIPSYQKGGETVWFEDAESVRRKIEVSRSLGIDSFAFWRLGGEDPAIWQMLNEI